MFSIGTVFTLLVILWHGLKKNKNKVLMVYYFHVRELGIYIKIARHKWKLVDFTRYKQIYECMYALVDPQSSNFFSVEI